VSKSVLNDLDKEMREYLDVNQISSQMETVFSGSQSTAFSSSTPVDKSRRRSSKFLQSETGSKENAGLDPILEENAMNMVVEYKPNSTLAE